MHKQQDVFDSVLLIKVSLMGVMFVLMKVASRHPADTVNRLLAVPVLWVMLLLRAQGKSQLCVI